MHLPPPVDVDTADEARELAIEWQSWASSQDLSYEELIDYTAYFEELSRRFDLGEEFRENGII